MRRRVRLAVVSAAVVLVLSPWLLTYLGNFAAAHAIQRRDYVAAGQWVQVASFSGIPSAETQFLKARLQRHDGKLDAMQETLLQAVKQGLAPERADREQTLAIAQSGNIAAVQRKLREMLIDQQGDGPEISDAYLNGCLIQRNFEDAEVLLEGWKADFPADPKAPFMEGRLREFLRDRETATECYVRSLKLNENFLPAAFALGRLRLQDNRPEAAADLFRRCLQLENPVAAQIELAKALNADGQSEAARELLGLAAHASQDTLRKSYRAVGAPLDGLPAHAEMGELELQHQNYKEAVKWLDEALLASPQNLSLRYSRATALRGAGRGEEAAQEFEEVSRIRKLLTEVDQLVDEVTPDTAAIEKRLRIGQLYYQYRSADVGAYWVKSILRFEPEYEPAHRFLAKYYREKAENNPAWAAFSDLHDQRRSQP
ncbi:MAG: hypothetical protein Fues2KO_11690 [Fuerstiella sp.]